MRIPISVLLLTLGWFVHQGNAFAQERISAEDVRGAAKLIGLEFEDREIDSLLPNLHNFLNRYDRNRAASPPNNIAPSLIFSPLPEGFEVPKGNDELNVRPLKCTRPENLDDLSFYSIPQLAYLVQSRLVTSVELTNHFIQRLLRHDNTLHCVITYTGEYALEYAEQMDREIASGQVRGLLHGIPYGIKDLFSKRGYRTTWGAEPFREQFINTDAAVVEKLEAAGAILIAKLSLGALAMGDVWFEAKTRNPWDPSSGSSGSSAGSAAAVSAGLVPFAIGTETLGSIVSPSTVCGTTGLRPTFGRVSRHGAMALSWSMDKIGPICRSVEDCAIVFAMIEGADERDQTTTDATFNYPPPESQNPIRIGYVPDHFASQWAFGAQDSATLRKLGDLGFELDSITLPDYPDITFLLSTEAAAAFDDLTRSGEDDLMVRQIRAAWPNAFRAARFVPAVEYINANRLRTILIAEMHRVFQEVDIIVHPSWGNSMLSIGNMTGHPSVVLPNGFQDGTPTSITLTGRLYDESVLLRVAKQLQDALGYKDITPPGF